MGFKAFIKTNKLAVCFIITALLVGSIASLFFINNDDDQQIYSSDELLAQSITSHLDKYKDKTINLNEPRTKLELVEYLFADKELAIASRIWSNDSFTIWYWSTDAKAKPMLSGFKVHEDFEMSHESPSQNRLLAAPLSDMDIIRRKTIVVETSSGFAPLTSQNIYELTGFDTQASMNDFIFLDYKLLIENSDFYRQTISRGAPVVFENYHYFDNFAANTNRFQCDEHFDGNLQAQYFPNEKRVELYSHSSASTMHDSLNKLIIAVKDGTIQVIEYKNVLQCGTQIVC